MTTRSDILTVILTILIVGLSAVIPAQAQRKITPVTPSATASQAQSDRPKREINPKANLAEAKDAQGNIIFIDTITGQEWVDSTAIKPSKKMQYPLMESVTIGLNLWDPAMRLLGQDYGGVDIWGELSLHNRYKPVFEFGLGSADITPDGNNYTFKAPMAPYFKIGMNYNIFYNNNPAYEFLVGIRYGFTPFKYEISNFAIDNSYWGESEQMSIPQQSSTAGYFEFMAGVRVMIWKGISLGWMAKYHTILHESKSDFGESMYIPGYGKRGGTFTASFSISYTLQLNKKDNSAVNNPEATGQ